MGEEKFGEDFLPDVSLFGKRKGRQEGARGEKFIVVRASLSVTDFVFFLAYMEDELGERILSRGEVLNTALRFCRTYIQKARKAKGESVPSLEREEAWAILNERWPNAELAGRREAAKRERVEKLRLEKALEKPFRRRREKEREQEEGGEKEILHIKENMTGLVHMYKEAYGPDMWKEKMIEAGLWDESFDEETFNKAD